MENSPVQAPIVNNQVDDKYYSSDEYDVDSEDETLDNIIDGTPVLHQRDWKPHVTWYFGPSGTGKTQKAFEKMKDDGLWISSFNRKGKWLGYNGEESIILDNLTPSEIEFNTLLRVLDPYPMFVDNGEYVVSMFARNIIITSLYHPVDIPEYNSEITRLMKRIDKIIKFKWNGDDYVESGTLYRVDKVITVTVPIVY